MLDLAS